jgi:hypothetical protein
MDWIYRRNARVLMVVAALLPPVAVEAQLPFPDYGQRMIQYSGNPLLTLESNDPWVFGPGSQDALPGTIHPDVLYFPQGEDNFKFWMVFTPYDGFDNPPFPYCEPFYPFPTPQCPCGPYATYPDNECPPPPWASPLQYWERLTIVRSHDGINWVTTGITNPVISPDTGCTHTGYCPPGPPPVPCTWDQGVHYDPDLVHAPDGDPQTDDWFLYFAVANPCMAPEFNPIGLARSSNGKVWNKIGPVTPGEEALATPTVVYDSAANNGQGQFYMWYVHDHSNLGGMIGFATSPDGVTWTPVPTPDCPSRDCGWKNAVLKPDFAYCEGGLSHPDVIRVGNEFWMYYQVQAPRLPPAAPLYHDMMIRRAVSTDGINWTKDPAPILSKFASADFSGCDTANVMPDQWTFWDRFGPQATPATVTMFYRPSAVAVGNAMYFYFGGLDKESFEDNPSDRDIGLAFSSRFSDVPPIHWAYEAVEAVVLAQIASGCGSNNFCPDTGAVRQEVAAFIGAADGSGPQNSAHDAYFCDVLPDTFAPHINFVYERGIMEECGDCTPPSTKKRFCRTDTINRLELGVAFYRALGLQPWTGPYYFTDLDGPYLPYRPMMDRLYMEGVVSGCDGAPQPPRYCPTPTATRAELAAITADAYNLRPSGLTGSAVGSFGTDLAGKLRVAEK